MKNTLEIEIKPFESVDMINLYLIIKSYSCNLIYISFNLHVLIKNFGEKEFIAHTVNVNFFKNTSFSSFSFWFYEQLKNDWKYLNQPNSNYYFLFTYPVLLFDKGEIQYLKPKYPWDPALSIKLIGMLGDEDKFIKLIAQQKEKINELTRLNDKLKKKIKRKVMVKSISKSRHIH